MGALEKIAQMKSQGISDEEIINNLREEGITPKEIEDAFNQLQIKSAIAGDTENWNQTEIPELPPQPSVSQSPQQEISSQQYPPQQEYYQQENYGYSPQTGGADTDTIIEIAEQVFSEKVRNIQKQIEDMNNFKTIAQTKIEMTEGRLKRIESMIDQLQITILEKISSYGRNMDSTKKEIAMMQDTFEKMINPIINTAEKRLSEKQEKKNISKKK